MITYTEDLESIHPKMLTGFFHQWKKPLTPETHLKILNNSDYCILAIDTDNSQVVGFITALTDGFQSAFISLLEVQPNYRGKGIGSNLVTRMLEKLTNIPAIDLTCDPSLQCFYSRLGMKPSVGMVIRHY